MVDLKAKPFYLDDKGIEWVEKTLTGLSIEEKVGQLFCEIIDSTQENDIERLFSIVKPGGIMYRPLPLEQAHAMSVALQERSDTPMLIAGNLERGGNGACIEGTYFGSPMQIAATDDEECGYRLGLISCREGAAIGCNWSFEPLLDIDYNPMNPIANVRTFGSDPERIIRMAKAYTRGAHEAGVAVSVKHWPGDGMDFREQHLCSSVNTKSVEEWEESFGYIYRELIEAGADSLMAAHIRLPSYSKALNPELKDEDILPASLSYELTTTLLREKMGYNGLVVTDASQMAGFTMFMPRKDAVPASIAAGCDMFLFTICHEEDVQYMLDGVKNGVITEERLNEAVTRILALKASLKLHEKQTAGTLVPTLEEAKKIIGCKEHVEWTADCADKAVTLVKNKNNVIPISPEKSKRILFRVVTADQKLENVYDPCAKLFRQLLEEGGFEVTDFSDKLVPGNNVNAFSIASMTEKFDMVVYLVNVGSGGGATERGYRISWTNGMRYDVPKYSADIPCVMVSLYSPYHLMDAQMVQGYINCYSPTEAIVRTAAQKLLGKSEFKGVSPVDAFCGLWDTRL